MKLPPIFPPEKPKSTTTTLPTTSTTTTTVNNTESTTNATTTTTTATTTTTVGGMAPVGRKKRSLATSTGYNYINVEVVSYPLTQFSLCSGLI